MADLKQDLFENIGHASGRVKCLPCSQVLRTLVPLKSNGQRQHLLMAKLIEAVASLTRNEIAGLTVLPVISASPSLRPVAANLSLAARFDPSNSESEDAGNVADNVDLFDQVEITNDRHFDASGVEIELSAGIFPTANTSWHNQLDQQMDDLHQYDHSILGEEGILQMGTAG